MNSGYNYNNQIIQSNKDAFIAGYISGIAQVLTIQPFDLMKVRYQTAIIKGNNQNVSFSECALSIYKQEGLLAYYKGVGFPLISSGCLVSVSFGVNEFFKKQFAYYQQDQMSLFHYSTAGAISGAATSIISIPSESVRIKMQQQTGPKDKHQYQNSLDCIRQVYSKFGIKGIFQGFKVSLLREVLGYGAYFGSYEYGCQQYCSTNNTRRNNIPSWALLVAGSLAGVIFWVASFPVDTIKTQIQSACYSKQKGCIQIGKEIIRSQGTRGFFKGFGHSCTLCIPSNAIGFLVYERAFNQLSNQQRIKL